MRVIALSLLAVPLRERHHRRSPRGGLDGIIDDAQAGADQARRPDARALRPRSHSRRPRRAEPEPGPVRRRTATCAGTRCAASGSPTPATARTARSCRRPSTTRSRRRRDPAQPDGAAGGPVGRGRLREPVPDARRHRRTTRRRSIVDTRARARRLRGGRVHAGPARVARQRCRSWHLELLARGLGATATASSARATTCSTCSSSRTAASRSGVTLLAPARADLRLPVRAARRRPASCRSQAEYLARARPRPARGSPVAREIADGRRLLYDGDHVVAVRARLRALSVRGLDCAAAAGPVDCGPRRRRAARLRARAEDRAAEVRRAVVEAVPVRHGVPPGAHRRRSRTPRRTSTSSSTRPTACRAA